MKRKVLWQNDFVILYDAGDFHKYDGLTGLFVKLVNADNELLKDAYMKNGIDYLWEGGEKFIGLEKNNKDRSAVFGF